MKLSVFNRIFGITIVFFFIQFSVSAQELDINAVYQSAIKAYDSKNYNEASNQFSILINKVGFKIQNTGVYYNGACIYALNNQPKKALELLNHLVNDKLYSNYKHISRDGDLNSLHTSSQWDEIIDKVKTNLITLPERNRKTIKNRLSEAKKLLDNDNGSLWGENIWHTDFLIIDYDSNIYSLKPITGFKTTDSILFYSKIKNNELSFTNSVQEYKGKKYATILNNYLKGKSTTLIHELFHTLQFKHKEFNGNPVSYLDNYDARQWLRLEYQALRLTLQSISNNEDLEKIKLHLNDALIFRKLRQIKYKEHLKNELELETLEGLANYTGIKLSAIENKYEEAIHQINEREVAETYTRPFPYATGPAYGLVFDYLNIDWKKGLDVIYNFLEIYEAKIVKKEIVLSNTYILQAKERNNYERIHQEELSKKTRKEDLINFYTKMLIDSPTLSVTSIDEKYGRTYNMNGTISLDEDRTIFSSIKGTAKSKEDFGNFYIKDGKLGKTGILGTWIGDVLKFTFPLPKRIEGNKIIGDFYELEFNKGWEIVKINDKGSLEIRKMK
ncbi:TPR end-of-group domain-containing protein [Tenacibaculum xiamenense]|uniref:TPR end-of-group domain-containing protein n=1 Tax=Tenacibaculum xiamenense TaxID=1261553 RepID=UPI003895C3CD